ncbi:MAG TPA: hypothetical protein VM032_01745 [Vicinamibacterales bacterium]|nr:hypothetical protein [Vicinamibacterales bacterium]
MPRLMPITLVLLSLVAAGCGAADPDVRMADWEENFDRVNAATAAGDHQQAIAVSQAFLTKYPDNADGHLMVAGALTEAARAATDQQRPARFTEAASHYRRVLELTRNPTWRVLAISGLIQVYGKGQLNNPDEATRYARLQVSDSPTEIASYLTLVDLLKESKKYDEVLAVLTDARTHITQDGDSLARYAGIVHDLVAFNPDFPRDKAQPLLAETVALIDQSLGKDGRTANLVRARGMLLRVQGEVEPDPARQAALGDESRKTFEELDRLEK